MAASGDSKDHDDRASAHPGQPAAEASAMLKPENDPTMQAPAGNAPGSFAKELTGDMPVEVDDLHTAIKDLMELFDTANDLARRGDQVNIDILAMRVAVLCDAICDADPAISQPFRGDLEALLGHLNLLENTMLRERVQLALTVEAADRRQRAKLAYGRVLPSMSPAGMPNKLPEDKPLDTPLSDKPLGDKPLGDELPGDQSNE